MQALQVKIVSYLEYERSNRFLTVRLAITPAMIPALIGANGATVKALEEATKCKFDFQKTPKRSICVVKGRYVHISRYLGIESGYLGMGLGSVDTNCYAVM